MKTGKSTALPIIVLLIAFSLFSAKNIHAQSNRKSLQQCIDMALTENLQIRSADLGIEQAKALQGTAFNPAKTGIEYAQDPITTDLIDKKIGITQSFEFPTVYTSQGKMLKQETLLAEKSKNITQNEIVRNVSELSLIHI